MRCIPRGLLIHRARIMDILSEDCFGQTVLSEGTELKYVRIDRESADEKTGHALKCTGNALLIYDSVSSVPRGFEFRTGQRVSFMGDSFRITAVRKLYDRKKLHHIEAEMEEIL